MHRRLNWEFFFVLSGKCRPVFDYTIPDTNQPFRTRTLWVFPPETPHGWHGWKNDACEIAVFHFSSVPSLIRKLVDQTGYLTASLSRQQCQQLSRDTGILVRHYQKITEESMLIFNRALLDFCLMAVAGMDFKPIPQDVDFNARKVDACIAWYLEHMAERPKLEDVARSANLSVRHLRRLFHLVRGESPQRTFTNIKIERAMDLLVNSSAKIDGVARDCGFSSGSDFCRVFSQIRGISPDAWRRQGLSNCKKKPW
ncbi:MAG TPA: AraC family transcriptional regulator [Kiritimatiellia bacterium]|nr:AraC family transcriptional regulator [Kiritimatiellia bacterium]